jgi:hypothetical protein
MRRFTALRSALVFGSLGAFALSGAPTSSLAADQAIVLSPVLPATVAVPQPNPDLSQLQTDFDVFSWQTFVALNWPANSNGSPNTDVTIGQQGALTQSVWETWKESIEVFKDDGTPPAPWGVDNRYVPPECRTLTGPDGNKVLPHLAKKPDVLFSSTQPFLSGPLIDQNGQFARFEISMNRSMFDYIVNNVLYNTQGQQRFADAGKKVAFACTNNGTSDTGAVMVKAAWKILGQGDDKTRFYTRKALVWTPGTTNTTPQVPATCAVSDVGMIGLHIATKVQNNSQWVWSTFEHKGNVPDLDNLPAQQPYSFYNQDCKDCTPVNQPPPRPWDPTKPGKPTLIARVTPIDAPTTALNKSWQAALAAVNPNSPWQNYDLVSTQWPTLVSKDCNTPATGASPLGNPAPQFLANTTLESYIQGNTPNVSSSSIGCHKNATAMTGKFSDFTYMLSMAHPLAAPAPATTPAPAAPAKP